jgi:hypothetical protein
VFAIFLSIGSPVGSQPLKELYQQPPADGSFVRVVNATLKSLSIRLSGDERAEFPLNSGRASDYQFVHAPGEVGLSADGQAVAPTIHVTQGRFITLVVSDVPNAKRVKVVEEAGSILKGLEAEIRFYNFTDCTATLRIVDGAAIFENVKPFKVKRRFVNPVSASLSASCSASPDAKLQVNELQAGVHYSIFLFGEPKRPKISGQIDQAQYRGVELR